MSTRRGTRASVLYQQQ